VFPHRKANKPEHEPSPRWPAAGGGGTPPSIPRDARPPSEGGPVGGGYGRTKGGLSRVCSQWLMGVDVGLYALIVFRRGFGMFFLCVRLTLDRTVTVRLLNIAHCSCIWTLRKALRFACGPPMAHCIKDCLLGKIAHQVALGCALGRCKLHKQPGGGSTLCVCAKGAEATPGRVGRGAAFRGANFRQSRWEGARGPTGPGEGEYFVSMDTLSFQP